MGLYRHNCMLGHMHCIMSADGEKMGLHEGKHMLGHTHTCTRTCTHTHTHTETGQASLFIRVVIEHLKGKNKAAIPSQETSFDKVLHFASSEEQQLHLIFPGLCYRAACAPRHVQYFIRGETPLLSPNRQGFGTQTGGRRVLVPSSSKRRENLGTWR